MGSDILASGEYKQLPTGRMNKLREFLKSEEFGECLAKACVSSLPRWRYAREIATDPRKKQTPTDIEMDSSDSDADFPFVSDIDVCQFFSCHISPLSH